MLVKMDNTAPSSTVEIAIAAGKHGRGTMSRSPWVRPGTWNSCAGGGAPATLQRSPFALQWCPALRRRWAPQNNSCAFHRMWNTTRGSLRSRSAAKSCASPCSTSVIGGQKHELDAIVYFDLLFRFSCPRQFPPISMLHSTSTCREGLKLVQGLSAGYPATRHIPTGHQMHL